MFREPSNLQPHSNCFIYERKYKILKFNENHLNSTRELKNIVYRKALRLAFLAKSLLGV